MKILKYITLFTLMSIAMILICGGDEQTNWLVLVGSKIVGITMGYAVYKLGNRWYDSLPLLKKINNL